MSEEEIKIDADKVGDDNLVDLLRYYELVKEIKVANGIQI